MKRLVTIAVLAAAFMAATVPRAPALAQPDPAVAVHVETAYVNLTAVPSFVIAVAMPSSHMRWSRDDRI